VTLVKEFKIELYPMKHRHGHGHDIDIDTITSIKFWKNDMIQCNYKCYIGIEYQYGHISDTPNLRSACASYALSN
jgi:hypothetical protein